MNRSTQALAALAAAIAVPAITAYTAMAAVPDKPSAAASKSIERGKYLVKIAGCNDCHTPGYLMNNGNVPEAQWLTGETFGWRGPWGTTYAVNLRLYMQTLNEDEWLKRASTLRARPPMPWYVLHEMTKEDLRAIYRYVRHLGAAGQPAPFYLAPDKEPPPPYAQFPSPPK